MVTFDPSSITGAVRLLRGLGYQVVIALGAPSQTSIPPHVGMFAGSLLSHHAWTPPKVPH